MSHSFILRTSPWNFQLVPELIWSETQFFYNKVAEHIRWVAWNWPLKRSSVCELHLKDIFSEKFKVSGFFLWLFLQYAYPINALTNTASWWLHFTSCRIISSPDKIKTFLGSSFCSCVALRAAWGPINLIATLSSVDLIGYPLLPPMDHCRASSLSFSTYFYWMQGPPESQDSTLKLVLVPWLQPCLFLPFYSCVSIFYSSRGL